MLSVNLLRDPELTMPTEPAKKFFSLMRITTLIFAVVCVALLLFWLIPPAEPPFVLPNPNGYDDFIRAGAMAHDDYSAYPIMEHETLASSVATNSEALAAARLGLSRKCSAHTDQLITNNKHAAERSHRHQTSGATVR